MLLGGIDTIALITLHWADKFMSAFFISIFSQKHFTLRCCSDLSPFAFQREVSDGLGRKRAPCKTVRIYQAVCSIIERELRQHTIFAFDQGVQLSQLAKDRGDFPNQKPERIQEMNDHLVDQQPLHLAKVR